MAEFVKVVGVVYAKHIIEATIEVEGGSKIEDVFLEQLNNGTASIVDDNFLSFTRVDSVEKLAEVDIE